MAVSALAALPLTSNAAETSVATGEEESDTVANVIIDGEFTPFDSFSEAVEFWCKNDGSTLMLCRNVEIDTPINFTGKGKINMGTYGIMYTGSEKSCVIYNSGELEIRGYGHDKLNYITLENGRGVAVSDEGVEGENCLACCGAYITGGTGCGDGQFGGGIFSCGDNAKLDICDVTICGNTAQSGGGIFLDGTRLDMYDCKIINNKANPDSGLGGGLFVNNNAVAVLNGSLLSKNSAAYGGGVMDLGELLICGGQVERNTATEAGAGVFAFKDSEYDDYGLVLSDSAQFYDNMSGDIRDDILLQKDSIVCDDSFTVNDPIAVNTLDPPSYVVICSPDFNISDCADKFYTTYGNYTIELISGDLKFVPVGESQPATDFTLPEPTTQAPTTEPTEPTTQVPTTEPTQPTTQVPATEATQPTTEVPATEPTQPTAKPSQSIAPTPKPLAKATATTVVSDSKRIIYIFCDDVKGADTFLVNYRKAGAKKWTSKYTDDVNSLTVKGVEKNKCYEIRVKAFGRKDGVTVSGKWSDTYRAFVAGVKLGKITRSKKTATLKWKKNTKVSGYQVSYSTKSSMKGKKTVNVKGKNKTGCKLKGLKAGKKYYVEVRAYKTVKGKKFYSEYFVSRI